MSNQITGRVLSISPITQVAGRNGMITKRSIIIDCSRFNPNTGEKYENTPMLEFIGNGCNDLDNFRNGDLVTITFDVQGTKYVAKDGQTQIFTRVRPYKIEAKPVQQVQQPQPFQQQQFQQQQQFPPQQQFYGSGQSPDVAPQQNNFFGGGEVPF